MALWRKRVIGEVPKPQTSPAALPAAAKPSLARGEQVLATAQEDSAGHWVVLTNHRLLEQTEEGQAVVERPWHEVDTGSWDPDVWALSVSFVDRLGGRQWVLKHRSGPGSIPEVFRERTSATVVLTRAVNLGPRRSALVSIRTVLASRELIEQVSWGRGSDQRDPELVQSVHAARLDLRDQVGMPPVPAADSAAVDDD